VSLEREGKKVTNQRTRKPQRLTTTKKGYNINEPKNQDKSNLKLLFFDLIYYQTCNFARTHYLIR